MKVIFLDIDGIINCWDTKERALSKCIGVEQRLIAHIKEIVDATCAVKIAIDILTKEDNPYGGML